MKKNKYSTMENKRFLDISKAIYTNYYTNLGEIDIEDDSTLECIKIKVIPHEGIHSNKPYKITLKFTDDWPLIYIDSELFDKIKTPRYLKNHGKNGSHKGICIHNFSYGYSFNKNFKELCNNKWDNYIYYLITVFNNIQDFDKGNGIRSDYKQILSI